MELEEYVSKSKLAALDKHNLFIVGFVNIITNLIYFKIFIRFWRITKL